MLRRPRRRVLVPQDELSLPGLSRVGKVVVIIECYQLYAVQKWIVDRTAHVCLLVVYTGDPSHSVHLHVYESEDDDALDLLASHAGAKRKETTEGVLVVTSLSHFRSESSIVHIPDGKYSDTIKYQLYTNINLLRLGSSGRAALTLTDPSEATQDRFLTTYHTHPSHVLQLVSLIQSALVIFGDHLLIDGLLCDNTLQAISQWSTSYDLPSVISLLLSLVLSTRNRLAHLGFSHLLPTDPFASPLTGLSPALAAYQSLPLSNFVPLSNLLINSISASFQSKPLSRHLKSRLNSDSLSLFSPINHLPTFISIVSSSTDLAPDTLSAIWSSPSLKLPKFRSRLHSDDDDQDESDRFTHTFHWPPRSVKLRSWAALTKRKHHSVDLAPSNLQFDRDRPLPAVPSDSSTAVNLLSVNRKQFRPSSSRKSTTASTRPQSPPLYTSFFGDGDDEDLLSSGQVSPLSDSQARPNPFYFSLGGSQAHLLNPDAVRSLSGAVPSSSEHGMASGGNSTPLLPRSTIDENMLAKLLLAKGNKGKGVSDDTIGSGIGTTARIASWAGPVRVGRPWADTDSDGEELECSDIGLSTKVYNSKSVPASASLVLSKDWGNKKEKARFDNLIKVVDAEGHFVEQEMDSEDDDESLAESSSESGRRVKTDAEVENGDGAHEINEEEEEERRELVFRRATRAVVKGELRRRRSFHDLDSFRDLEILSPKRMKIDVELCGQCLIMWRREEHLRNVVGCIRVLTSTLSNSNSFLRSHYQSHLPSLTALSSLSTSNTPSYLPTGVLGTFSRPSSIASRSRSASPQPQRSSPHSTPTALTSPSPSSFSRSLLPQQTPSHILQSINDASQQTERFLQATNTLLYEKEQFDVGALWNWVGRERRKVWALRRGVFGEGNGGGAVGGKGKENGDLGVGEEQTRQGRQTLGRKLPEGVQGAHGTFNRLQWRLDGHAALVDDLGRTESEAEEEGRIERGEGSGGAYDSLDEPSEAGQPKIEGDEMKQEQGTSQDPDEEAEVESLDRYGIRPMWLLKFFTSWGARWSVATANIANANTNIVNGSDGKTTTDMNGNGLEVATDDGGVS